MFLLLLRLLSTLCIQFTEFELNFLGITVRRSCYTTKSLSSKRREKKIDSKGSSEASKNNLSDPEESKSRCFCISKRRDDESHFAPVDLSAPHGGGPLLCSHSGYLLRRTTMGTGTARDRFFFVLFQSSLWVYRSVIFILSLF